jgi:hypothetical protein
MHGLNTLDSETYTKVTAAADRIEYEPWMLQVGAELWRRFLTLLPTTASMAQILTHLSQLPPPSLEELTMAIVDDPTWARELVEGLIARGQSHDEKCPAV